MSAIVIIFILSFAAILAVYRMFRVPFVPFKHGWDEVIFNLAIAAVLAFMFDRGAVVVAAVVLCGKLLWEKFRQVKNAVTGDKKESKEDGTV
jgi:hypothetical protein